MEITKNELPQNVKTFFYNLSEYLDTPFLYFGSVQRSDYVHGKSDIDVDIFTDNVNSTVTKWIIKDTTTYGYKLKYKNEKKNINAEFSIYNEKFKDLVLAEHNSKRLLPLYVSILLYILKFVYYQFPLLDKKTFNYLKRLLINNIFGKDGQFLVLDVD